MASFNQHIEAFKIFSKYTEDGWPLSAEHDIIYCHVSPAKVSDEDKKALEDLDWSHSDGDDNFYHYV